MLPAAVGPVVGDPDVAVRVALARAAVLVAVADLVVLGVDRRAHPPHDRCEAALRAGLVLDDACGAVRVLEAVAALHVVPVPVLVLLLRVAGVRVLDGVVELVVGGALRMIARYRIRTVLSRVAGNASRSCASDWQEVSGRWRPARLEGGRRV